MLNKWIPTTIVNMHIECDHLGFRTSNYAPDIHIYGKFLGVLFTGIIIKGQAQQ
jgi:hypothetical protein